MKTTTNSVTLGELRKQQLRRARYRNSNAAKKNVSVISKYIESWGEHVLIYQDKYNRKLASEIIAHRLGVSETFVEDKMNYFHRIADYDSGFVEEENQD